MLTDIVYIYIYKINIRICYRNKYEYTYRYTKKHSQAYNFYPQNLNFLTKKAKLNIGCLAIGVLKCRNLDALKIL